MLDTTTEIEIPEGVTLSLPKAGLISRGLALLIDLIIQVFISWLGYLILSNLLYLGAGLYNILGFLLSWFYFVFFEMFFHGQSPGKKIFGLLVVNDDGTLINWSSSIIRNLLRIADFLPFAFLFGTLSILFSKDFKRLGDYTAGTMVIHKNEHAKLAETENKRGLPPKIPLTLEEQASILSFSERSHSMSQARVNELANILKHWLPEQKSAPDKQISNAEILLRMAQWIRGHK